MSIIEKIQSTYGYVTNFVLKRKNDFLYIELLQYLIFSIIYLVAWVSPSKFSPEFIISLQIIMLFEFVLVHSGIFMSLGKYAALFFFPFYFLFAWAFNHILPDNTIMYLYLFTIFNRFLIGFDVTKRKNDNPLIRAFYRCFATYFPIFVGTILFSKLLPDFGLTADIQKEIQEAVKVNFKGDITLKMNISCGFFYYLLLIFWELYFLNKNNESVNLLFISSNKIGSVVKSKLSSFSDYVYEINNIENLNLEKFPNYSFTVKRKNKYFKNITDKLELIVITENSEWVEKLKNYLKSRNLSHIPILDLSSVICPLTDEILLAYKQKVPEHFQNIPNNHHPIKQSIKKSIFNEIIGPAIKNYKKKESFISSLDPNLRKRLINKLKKINVY